MTRARTAAAAAAALASLTLPAGCGSASGVRVGAPEPGSGSPRPGCGDAVVDLAATGAHDVCLTVGSTVRVQADHKDVPAVQHGNALTKIAPGVYRAARAGSAELSGFRRACPGAALGAASCHAIVGWKVAVQVR